MTEEKYFELVGRYSAKINILEFKTHNFLREIENKTHKCFISKVLSRIQQYNEDSGVNDPRIESFVNRYKEENKIYRNVIFHQAGVTENDVNNDEILVATTYINWKENELKTFSSDMITIHTVVVEELLRDFSEIQPLASVIKERIQ